MHKLGFNSQTKLDEKYFVSQRQPVELPYARLVLGQNALFLSLKRIIR